MSIATADVPVLIVGAGPVGLTARVLLERWGVRSLLVEKRSELSTFPRSRLTNVRSMEIFRRLGVAAEIEARAFAPRYGRIRFCDTLLDRDFAVAEMVGVHAPLPESPVVGVVTSQDRIEPVLASAAKAELRFGVELVDLSMDSDRVLASLIDRERGVSFRVSAGHVIAADGANSTVRDLLGIGVSGPGAVAHFTTVVFDADLNRWCADRPAGVYFTPRGSFAPLYPEGGWAWFVPTPEDVHHPEWPHLLGRALGPVDTQVLRIQHWTMNAFVADEFQSGRVRLVGDAAHAIPIMGGLGMNAGIADVHNLCWKLAGNVHGWADPGLLHTYETERKPVADRTLRQAVANTELVMQVQERRRQHHADGPQQEIELPWSDRYFAQLGLVLGVAYESSAVIADGSIPPTPSDPVTDYLPTARPGHRLPHLLLGDARSTLDAIGEWFTLLTPDPDRWSQLVGGPWPVHIEPLPTNHADHYGLSPRGALLVRPDDHVAARWPNDPPDDNTLHHALAAICRPITS